MPVLNISKDAQQIYPQGGRALVINTDVANPVYISQSRQPNAQDPTITPLGSIELDGGWFASTLDPDIVIPLAVLPGASGLNPSPFIQNLNSKSLERQGPGGGGMFFSFPAAGRIWGASVDLSIASSGSYPAGTTNSAYARVRTSSAITLAITGVAIGNDSDQNSNGSDRDIPGLQVDENTELELDVNGGASISDAVITADCTVLFSIP